MAFFCWFCWAHTLVWSIGVCSVRRFFSPQLLLFLLGCCALCAKTIMHFGIFETIKRLHIASANKFAYRKFKCIIRCGVCAYDDDGGAAAALQEPNLHRYCLFFMRRPTQRYAPAFPTTRQRTRSREPSSFSRLQFENFMSTLTYCLLRRIVGFGISKKRTSSSVPSRFYTTTTDKFRCCEKIEHLFNEM